MPIIDAVLDDFFWRALIGGLGVALVAGPLGCFVVWRRMAYFGEPWPTPRCWASP